MCVYLLAKGTEAVGILFHLAYCLLLLIGLTLDTTFPHSHLPISIWDFLSWFKPLWSVFIWSFVCLISLICFYNIFNRKCKCYLWNASWSALWRVSCDFSSCFDVWLILAPRTEVWEVTGNVKRLNTSFLPFQVCLQGHREKMNENGK